MAGIFDDLIPQAPRTRNPFAVANDTVIEAANAAAGAVKAGADFVSPGNRLSQFIQDEIITPGEGSQSDVAQQSRRQFQQEVQDAEGFTGELGAVGRKILRDPLLTAAQAAGSFVVPGAAIKAGAALGGVRAGLVGGVLSGGALAGGDAAGQAYELSKNAGASEQEAVSAARQASVLPAIVGGVGGMFGAERLFAGAGGKQTGGILARMSKAGASEAAQEGFEEGVTNYEGQRAAMPFDATIDPWKGTAAAAGMGAALGGITGAGIAAIQRENDVQRYDASARLAASSTIDEVIAAATDLATPARTIAPIAGFSQAQADAAMAAMEQSAKEDQAAIKQQGRMDKSGLGGAVRDAKTVAPQTESIAPSAEFVDTAPVLDRILTVKEQLAEAGVRQSIRDSLGDEALNAAMYYTAQAEKSADIPARTRENMLEVAEQIVTRARVTPIQSQANQQTEQGSLESADPLVQLGVNAPLRQIALDTSPTGLIRVDAQGNAAPETRADAISLADRLREMRRRPDGMTEQASTKPRPQNYVRPVDAPLRQIALGSTQPVPDGLLMAKNGGPYMTQSAAMLRAKEDGGDVVSVRGGFAVQPTVGATQSDDVLTGVSDAQPDLAVTPTVVDRAGIAGASEPVGGSRNVGSVPDDTGRGMVPLAEAPIGRGQKTSPVQSESGRDETLKSLNAQWQEVATSGDEVLMASLNDRILAMKQKATVAPASTQASPELMTATEAQAAPTVAAVAPVIDQQETLGTRVKSKQRSVNATKAQAAAAKTEATRSDQSSVTQAAPVETAVPGARTTTVSAAGVAEQNDSEPSVNKPKRLTKAAKVATKADTTSQVEDTATEDTVDADTQQTFGEQSEDPAKFSRGAATKKTENFKSLVDAITHRWENAPEVIVAENMQDERIPQAARDEDTKQRSTDARGNPEGFYYGGKAYLLGENIKSASDAVRVLFHESLGHHGLRGTFGKELTGILDKVSKLSPGKVRAKANEYGLDFDNQKGRRQAAEEVLAEMAQSNPQLSIVKRAVAAIRSFMRDHVPGFAGMKFSDADIIANFILPARAWVKGGANGATAKQAEVAGRPLFSRDSAARNAKTKPLAVRIEDAMKSVGTNQNIRNHLADLLGNAGARVSWIDKTFSTQYAKAKKNKEFAYVFEATQRYLDDTSFLANEASGLAPSILPKLESWHDLAKSFSGFGLSDIDSKAIAAPIFEGTLTELKVFSDGELRQKFNLNQAQIGQYREFMAAVNASLDQMVTMDVLRLIGDKNPMLHHLAKTEGAAFRSGVEDFLTRQIAETTRPERKKELTELLDSVLDKYKRVDKLKSDGYAPLMRFGRYFVNIPDVATGESQFFGMYESATEANRAARELADDPKFAKSEIEQGTLSEQAYKLFSGLPVDSLEMFAQAVGAEESDLYQQFIKLTKNNRSAMKRLIARKGTAGFSQDVPRVLAAFVTSNARFVSGAMNLAQAKEDAMNIRAGDLKDEAIKLIDAASNPNETAAAWRGLMFMNFIGGSVASALVNVTQPVTMTLPYLSQWGGITKSTARLMSAAKQAATGSVSDPKIAKAMRRAEEEGIVSPQEIHHLTAQAMGSWGTNSYLKRLAFIWSAPFSLAEQFNRRTTFIAAYKTALDEKIADPFAFAETAVVETQGLYNKGNMPNLSRTAAGAMALQFKQYSIHYLEWMGRMWRSGPEGKRAVMYALALLMLAGGTDGLPFADDIDDLVDTFTQALGIDAPSKVAKREFIAKTLGFGDIGAEVMSHGLTSIPGIPLDLSIRMGMGNLLPATGILLRSNTDRSRDVLEVAGATGGLAKQYLDAGEKALKGEFMESGKAAVPVAIQNIAKAAQMWQTGEYRDQRQNKVMNVDDVDGLMKFIGFQPAEVARETSKLGVIRRSEQLAKNVEGEIAMKWARGVADGDKEVVMEAREELADWNKTNPGSPIRITSAQIIQRVRNMRRTREERFLKTVSTERRGAVMESFK